MTVPPEPAGPVLLPEDADRALLVGRAWSMAAGGPVPLLIRGGAVFGLSSLAPTVSQLFERPDLAGRLRNVDGDELGSAATTFAGPRWHDEPSGRTRRPDRDERPRRGAPGPQDDPPPKGTPGPRADDAPLRLLAPVDLQCIKACGVTFAVSVLERVVEEQARGDLAAAERIRATLQDSLGQRLVNVRPGSPEAAEIKRILLAEGLWSQYLEVGIGPDAEVFSKAPPLSAVGWGEWIGIRDDSGWNNPEPEIVLVCNSAGEAVGATLGNDVNLRDFEGRSALLLGQAKDNNASAAIGPFVRVFDGDFSMDSVRAATVTLAVDGEDGFRLRGESSMRLMSRDPHDLVAQTCGRHHDYPDGFALYLGSLLAPTQDRDEPGKGFTHHVGDTVTVASPQLGALVNRVTHSADAPRWEFGIGALMENLAGRGLLG